MFLRFLGIPILAIAGCMDVNEYDTCPPQTVENYEYHATLVDSKALEHSYRGHSNESNPPKTYQVMREYLGGRKANVSVQDKRIILSCLKQHGWPPVLAETSNL